MNGYAEFLALPAECEPWRYAVHIVGADDEVTFWRAIAAIKRIPPRKRKWDAVNRVWLLQTDSDADYVAAMLSQCGIEYSHLQGYLTAPEPEPADAELDEDVWGGI
jgi:hypothetical protein